MLVSVFMADCTSGELAREAAAACVASCVAFAVNDLAVLLTLVRSMFDNCPRRRTIASALPWLIVF